MHECPICGQACDCIGDDTWNDRETVDCVCDCQWAIDNGLFYDGEHDVDGMEWGVKKPAPEVKDDLNQPAPEEKD